MFKTSNIFGTVKRSIDVKNSIIIPTFTDVDSGDYLVTYRDDSFYSIYELDYFLNLIPFCNKNELKDMKSFLENKKHLDYYFINVMSVNEVDNQKRILLPKEVVDAYGNGHQVILNGAWDHLNIFKDEDHMQRILKK